MGRWYICAILTLLAFTGCPQGEDSWKHYSGGGHYPSRTPAMSPDGSVIVFSSPQSGNGDIYQIVRDGSNRTRLTDYPGFETDPIFSPDGSTIAFAREDDGCRHIWLMESDGSDQRQLTTGRVLDDVSAFSPDGSEVVFGRSPLSLVLGGSATHYSVNLQSKKVRQLEGLIDYPPNGKQIAYISAPQPPTILAQNRNERMLVEICGPVLFRRTTASKLLNGDCPRPENLPARLAKQSNVR